MNTTSTTSTVRRRFGAARVVGVDRERGSISVLAVIVLVLVLALFGLILDIADKTSAARSVSWAASEAARAAGQQLDPTVIGGAAADVAPAAAATQARRYLAQVGMTGSVQVTGRQITITASQAWRPRFYSVIGGSTLTATRTVLTTRTDTAGRPA